MADAFTRRGFLRLMSGALALPALESLGCAWAEEPPAASAAPPRAFVCLYVPNGLFPGSWMPTGTGPAYQLNRASRPLAPFQDRLTMLSGLSGHHSPELPEFSAHTNEIHFLSQTSWSPSTSRLSISMDQVIAEQIGQATSFPSLQLTGVSPCDSYWSTVPRTLSYDRQGRPLTGLADPQRIWQRLFGVERLSEHASLLDLVAEQRRDLLRQASAGDRERLDGYFTSVREIEARLARMRGQAGRAPAPPQGLDTRPAWLDRGTKAAAFDADYTRLMMDLIVVALQVDATRVITYQTHYATSELCFPQVGVTGSHHGISHLTEKQADEERLALIDEHLCASIPAYFVKRLRDTPDGAGTLLDRTAVLYGSGLTGVDHATRDLPFALLGGESLGFRHGRHLDFAKARGGAGATLSDLFLTIQRACGARVERFAASGPSLDRELLG